MSVPQRGFWRGPEGGDDIWLLGGLYTFKTRGSDNRDAYSLFEVQGSVATPRHLHEHEEEGFYVVEGKVTFLIGHQTIEATPGTFAFEPRGVEHGFKLESAEAKLLLLLTPGNARHEDLFTEMGEPARTRSRPTSSSWRLSRRGTGRGSWGHHSGRRAEAANPLLARKERVRPAWVRPSLSS